MDIQIFEDKVEELMSKWNLPALGWQWEYNNLKRTLGLCNYREKKLFFSTAFIPINPPEIIIDVIKHEISHALVGIGFGHTNVWKRKAIEVGAKPRSCQGNAISPEGKYKLECGCGVVHHFHRQPKYDVYRCRCGQRIFVKENNNVSSNARFISSVLNSL